MMSIDDVLSHSVWSASESKTGASPSGLPEIQSSRAPSGRCPGLVCSAVELEQSHGRQRAIRRSWSDAWRSTIRFMERSSTQPKRGDRGHTRSAASRDAQRNNRVERRKDRDGRHRRARQERTVEIRAENTKRKDLETTWQVMLSRSEDLRHRADVVKVIKSRTGGTGMPGQCGSGEVEAKSRSPVVGAPLRFWTGRAPCQRAQRASAGPARSGVVTRSRGLIRCCVWLVTNRN